MVNIVKPLVCFEIYKSNIIHVNSVIMLVMVNKLTPCMVIAENAVDNIKQLQGIQPNAQNVRLISLVKAKSNNNKKEIANTLGIVLLPLQNEYIVTTKCMKADNCSLV